MQEITIESVLSNALKRLKRMDSYDSYLDYIKRYATFLHLIHTECMSLSLMYDAHLHLIRNIASLTL
jgi:hypothetical protein